MKRAVWRWIVPLPSQPLTGWRSVLRWFALRALLFYGSLCLMLAGFQRSLIYHPLRGPALAAAEFGLPKGNAWDVSFRSDAGELHGVHVLPAAVSASSSDERRRLLREARLVVLYFPGNAGNRRYRVDELRLLAELDAHVILFDYRGYAENPGSPSEAALRDDARAAWNFLTHVERVPYDRIVLFGESLGGGVATPLAADLCREGTPPAGLALRATFNSLTAAASYHFPWLPVRWVLVDRFRSDAAIGDVTCPILMIHGQRDTIVPMALGRKLFDAAPERSSTGIPKRFVELPAADHNDILFVARAPFQAGLRQFFSALRSVD